MVKRHLSSLLESKVIAMEENKSEFVSIITPTYNCGKFIVKHIESILSQVCTDWTMIISDYYSTDNTKEVLALYLGRAF